MPKPRKDPLAVACSPDDREVWEAYVGAHPENQRNRLRLVTPHVRIIQLARRAGYQQQDLLDAVRGWVYDPWDGRKGAKGIEIILRLGIGGARNNVEFFSGLYRDQQEKAVPAAGTKLDPMVRKPTSPQHVEMLRQKAWEIVDVWSRSPENDDVELAETYDYLKACSGAELETFILENLP